MNFCSGGHFINILMFEQDVSIFASMFIVPRENTVDWQVGKTYVESDSSLSGHFISGHLSPKKKEISVLNI